MIVGVRRTLGGILMALLIAVSAILLNVLTVIGLSQPVTLGHLPSHFPIIVLFARVNSLSEEEVYQSLVLSALKK